MPSSRSKIAVSHPSYVAVLALAGASALCPCRTNAASATPPVTPKATIAIYPSAINTLQPLDVRVSIAAPTGDPVPAGTVKLTSGKYASAAVALNNGNVTFVVPAATLPIGTDSLFATYTPSTADAATYTGATATATVKVTPVTPAVGVTLSPTAIDTLQPLTVKVAVKAPGGAPVPAGTVKVASGKYASQAVALIGGVATIEIPAATLPAGTDSLSSTYTPSTASAAIYDGASVTSPVRVTLLAPTATIALSPAAIDALEPLTVKVSVAAPTGDPVPAGKVTLSSGKYEPAAATLNNGAAIFAIPAGTLPAGVDSLSATYTPSAADAGSYSGATATRAVKVSAVIPSATVTLSSSSITTLQQLAVKVAVAAPSGDPVPAGTVKLTSGSYASAGEALTNGIATFSIPAATLAAGADSVVASYTPSTADSAIYGAVTAKASVEVTAIAKVTPAIAVTPSATTIGTEQSLTVKATVSGPSGDPAPAGTVAVTAGTYASPATPLAAGEATIVIPAGSLAAGSETLKVTYTPSGTSAVLYNAASATSSPIAVFAQTLVAVNPASVGPVISNTLLGMNMAIWYPQSTPQILAAFQTAGITAMRWPGGSDSDLYHWQTNSLCGGGYTVPDGSFPSPLVSELWAPGKLDVAVTANYGTNAACNGPGEPSEAAAWVASALKNGDYVSHWTVGNEVYGSWETDMHAKPNDAATYANAVATGYYPQMKAANPKTLVGVVAQPNNNPPWDPIVMAKAKYDFVEYHYYPQAPGQESDTYLVHQAALDLTANINAVKADLAQYGKAGTPIYVGEIGSVYTEPGKQSSSITQALYAGQVLGELMNDGVSRATWWIGFGGCDDPTNSNFSSSLYGWQNFGGYMVFSDGTPEYGCENATPTAAGTLLPTARAFQLFSKVAVSGEYALTATVAGDTNDVRAYAATSGGGTALVLFNDNEAANESVLVQLSGQTAASSVTVETYDKAIYDQSKNNVWAPPTTASLGAQKLPLSLTLTPWSMNVVIVK